MMTTEFVDRIDSLGFFEYVEPSRLEGAKHEIQENGWVGVFGESGRVFNADAENLAEGGVGEFLSELTSFLEQQEVHISRVEDLVRDDEYKVLVGGQEHLIWNADELSRAETELGLLWGMATVRTFALVNARLTQAGSSERLYAVYGGNDLLGFFLTEKLRDAVRGHADATLESWPYLPKAEYPWFGQEHD